MYAIDDLLKIFGSCTKDSFTGLLGIKLSELDKIDDLNCILLLVNHITKQVYMFSGAAAIIGITWGGLMYLYASLNPSVSADGKSVSYDKPKKMISTSLIAFSLSVLLSLILDTILNLLKADKSLFPRSG